MKAQIKIFEKDREKCEALFQTLSLAGLDNNCLIIHGDGTNEELLIARKLTGWTPLCSDRQG